MHRYMGSMYVPFIPTVFNLSDQKTTLWASTVHVLWVKLTRAGYKCGTEIGSDGKTMYCNLHAPEYRERQ